MPAESRKGRTRKWVPLAADYMRALRSLEPRLTPRYIQMLQFHYARAARTTTAPEMAKAMGFKSYGAANLHYGKLARLVGNLVGWTPGEEGDIKLDVFAEFEKVRGQWQWIMRRELAQAIKGLGWEAPSLKLPSGTPVIPPPIPRDYKGQLRRIIRDVEWKSSSSEEYKLAPHQYIVAMKYYKQFKFLSAAIAKHGEYRTWLRRRDRRRFRYKYLILDDYCYWVMWPILNRAKANTLDKKAALT
jgi:hypothetical protein